MGFYKTLSRFLLREHEKLNHSLNQLPQESGGTSIKIERGVPPLPNTYLASSLHYLPRNLISFLSHDP